MNVVWPSIVSLQSDLQSANALGSATLIGFRIHKLESFATRTSSAHLFEITITLRHIHVMCKVFSHQS